MALFSCHNFCDQGDYMQAVKTYAEWNGMPSAQTKMVLGYLPSAPDIDLTDEDLAEVRCIRFGIGVASTTIYLFFL